MGNSNRTGATLHSVCAQTRGTRWS